MGLIASPNNPNRGITQLRFPPSPTPTALANPLILATHGITVAVKQVDILISKNQVLQILYLRHYVYKATQITMDKKPTKSTKI